jgi:hypothetical protein
MQQQLYYREVSLGLTGTKTLTTRSIHYVHIKLLSYSSDAFIQQQSYEHFQQNQHKP